MFWNKWFQISPIFFFFLWETTMSLMQVCVLNNIKKTPRQMDLTSAGWTEPACLGRGWRDEEIGVERDGGRNRGVSCFGELGFLRGELRFQVCVPVFIYRASAPFTEERSHTGQQSGPEGGNTPGQCPRVHTYFSRRKHAYQLVTEMKETIDTCFIN